MRCVNCKKMLLIKISSDNTNAYCQNCRRWIGPVVHHKKQYPYYEGDFDKPVTVIVKPKEKRK